MRCFIAINLPQYIKDSIEGLQADLDKQINSRWIKWTERDNLHITLKFLGETPESDIAKIEQILDKTLKNQKLFSLRLDGIIFLPSPDLPRIIAITIEQCEILNRLAEVISQDLKQASFLRDVDNKPFQCHITIGRNKGEANKIAVSPKPLHGSFEVKSVELMQSVLGRERPRYRVIKQSVILAKARIPIKAMGS
ncbi:MAG: RNA 2',3'-cyclic phosphodiesterase [Parcubacteria group bacterium]|nr:RNA 2',3'-cyclic phosphodiesterase [Parcubacteria group bacterium]